MSSRSRLLAIGDVLAYRQGGETRELAKRSIVFELGGISNACQDLVVNHCVLGEFVRRIAEGVSNPKSDLYICCDEAARLVGSPDSSVSDLISVVRGTGMIIDLAVRSAEVSRSVPANTPMKCIGRMSSNLDMQTAASCMGLDSAQREWMLRHLVPGVFVGQLSQGEFRHPFVFRIPALNL